jgi:phage shock protein C
MRMELSNRLYRSRSERMIAGVAGGVANYLDVDPTIVRILWVLVFLATGPLAVLAYLLCGIIIPREPTTTFV